MVPPLRSGAKTGRPTVTSWGPIFASRLPLGLVSVGLHGLVAFAVTRRSRELAVRIALGARARDLLFLLGRQALRPVAIGLLLGLPAAVLSAPEHHLPGPHRPRPGPRAALGFSVTPTLVGDPLQCREMIGEMRERYATDELIFADSCRNFEDRVRSHRLLAEALGLHERNGNEETEEP